MQSHQTNQILYVLCFLVATATATFIFPEGIVGVFILALGTLLIFTLVRRDEDKEFLQRIFLIALLVRVAFAAIIFYFQAFEYFGGDAYTYDRNGYSLLRVFFGEPSDSYLVKESLKMRGPGWGMNWFVAFIYLFVGRNIFATMAVECIIGAATAVLIYYVVIEIYNNSRVARLTTYFVALFPAMFVWSAQALKDGLIVFLLVLTMYCVIRLQKHYSFLYCAFTSFTLWRLP
jgi:4-amino-4-deoxy-L-arabinose transferase-like glycosyltransferase